MPDLLIRRLDPTVLKRLKTSASAHRRSLQAELHEILHRASLRDLAETRRLSERWHRRLRRAVHTDSTQLIRQDRDTR